MNFRRILSCVDTHTEGDPTRFLMSGMPKLPHGSVREKRDYFAKNHDSIRSLLMKEPRGHSDMFGAAIIESIRDECDFGVFFMDPAGYLDFCGHGIIASSTVMMGLLGHQPLDPNGYLRIETPAGIVRAHSIPERGTIGWEGVPSFFVDSGVPVETSLGTISADIAYGGNFFAFVQSEEIGLPVEKKNIGRLRKLGMEIKNKLNERVWRHPEGGRNDKIGLVEILDKPSRADARVRNILIYGDGQVGRDPCGSGLSAKIALEFAKGHLKLNEEYVYEGLLGTIFRGRAIKKLNLGSVESVIPEIEGRCFITAMSQYVLEEEDPFPEGWLLR